MRQLLFVLLGLWALVYAASFVATAITYPTGTGLTQGLNRIAMFYGWQTGAGCLALIIWGLSGQIAQDAGLRWLGRAPVILAAGLLVLTVAVILWANFAKQPATTYVPPGPPTAVPQPEAVASEKRSPGSI